MMKRRWQNTIKWIKKTLPLSLLILMIAGMTGCLGGGGLSGCMSCIPGLGGGGTDLTGILAIVLIGAAVWVFIKKFGKK